jgi:hypothetical protein
MIEPKRNRAGNTDREREDDIKAMEKEEVRRWEEDDNDEDTASPDGATCDVIGELGFDPQNDPEFKALVAEQNAKRAEQETEDEED